jgi:hypothetical protein
MNARLSQTFVQSDTGAGTGRGGQLDPRHSSRLSKPHPPLYDDEAILTVIRKLATERAKCRGTDPWKIGMTDDRTSFRLMLHEADAAPV